MPLHIVATKEGKEITLSISQDGAMIPIGSALNLPDAKLAGRGALTKLHYALERLRVADVKELG